MYTYVCVYIYVCIHVCVCIYTHIYIHIYIYIYIYMCIYIFIYVKFIHFHLSCYSCKQIDSPAQAKKAYTHALVTKHFLSF